VERNHDVLKELAGGRVDWATAGVRVSIIFIIGISIIYLHSSLMGEIKSLRKDLIDVQQKVARLEGENTVSKSVMMTLVTSLYDKEKEKNGR
jgi:hypothetical protein